MTADQTRIVVLDGHTLNPGDLSWERLESLGDTTIHPRTSPEEVFERSVDATIVLTNKALLPREVIERLPRLAYIGVTATGYNVIDVAAARQRGIPVTNVPGYSSNSVAQMVFAHVLNLTQRVAGHANSVQQGTWAASADWCFWEGALVELNGLVMGIVGLGRIGRQTARLAQAFGMTVLANGGRVDESTHDVQMVDLDTLFAQSDVVSLHCPLTEETRHLVSRARLALMKPTAFLVNTSRGPLVDEAALAEALNEGRLAGAGLDVLADEPPQADHPLITARNCYITPHIGWATQAARRRLMNTVIDNVAQFLAGNPVNVVNL